MLLFCAAAEACRQELFLLAGENVLLFYLLIALGHAAGGTIIIARQARENDLAGDAAAIASGFFQI